MKVDRSARMRWGQLPADVQAGVEAVLGSPVLSAQSQAGGFSNGTADRVRTRSGSTAFVKAISTAMNAGAADLHRREARITAALPRSVPAPRLLGVYDDGDWVALALQDIEGHHPALPWREPDLHAALDMLTRLAELVTPCPIADAPAASEVLADAFAGWDRIAASPPDDLDAWAAHNLPALRRLAADALGALHGDTLVHYDVRADNLLIDTAGQVTILDWPWACRGPAWLDTVMLLATVHLHGGHDVETLLSRGVTSQAEPQNVTAVLVAQAGYALDAARLVPPAGMGHLRAFQRGKAHALLRWARQRLDS
jgi:aminoglycoside phosphotransferase (APT) family kinase protein